MKLLRRQPQPEPDEEDNDLAPPFGVHPLIDLMAMQHYVIKQQADIWRWLQGFNKQQLRTTRLWMLVALGFLISAALNIWSSLSALLSHS
jgi:hypothetical protein